MFLNIDWVSIVLALLLGYVDDLILPKYYFYEDTIVGVYKKYQCPTYCAVDHNHFVYFSSDTYGMIIDEERLGPKYKPPKKDKPDKHNE